VFIEISAPFRVRRILHNLSKVACDSAGMIHRYRRDSMNRRAIWVVIAFALMAIGIGAAAYHFGVAEGLAESGKLAALPPSAMYPYGWHPWGHGFFFFPFLFLLLCMFALRRAFWGGHRCGGWRHRYDGVPPVFEEWHRRAHGLPPTTGTPPDSPPPAR
jgi:hypothetical protein